MLYFDKLFIFICSVLQSVRMIGWSLLVRTRTLNWILHNFFLKFHTCLSTTYSLQITKSMRYFQGNAIHCLEIVRIYERFGAKEYCLWKYACLSCKVLLLRQPWRFVSASLPKRDEASYSRKMWHIVSATL